MSKVVDKEISLEVPSNIDLIWLYGPNDIYIEMLEQAFTVSIMINGKITILGRHALYAEKALHDMIALIRHKGKSDTSAVEDIIAANHPKVKSKNARLLSISACKSLVQARNINQNEYIKNLGSATFCFGIGPAGTGKTMLAVWKAMSMLNEGTVEKILLTRPAVSGEDLGFLPGDINQKLDPYMRPIYDELEELVGKPEMELMIENGIIEIASVGYLRGRTLKRCFIILDEGQNATYEQLKTAVTRLGDGSVMAITGDPAQCDGALKQSSGLLEMVDRMKALPFVHVTHFESDDCIRHPHVAEALKVL